MTEPKIGPLMQAKIDAEVAALAASQLRAIRTITDAVGEQHTELAHVALQALKLAGYTVLAPDCDRRYACGWDGRPIGITDDRGRAQEAVDAALEQGQVGRWSLLEQPVGPWVEATASTGSRFWKEQR